MKFRNLSFTLAVAFLISAVYLYSEEPVDLGVVHRIKAEAFENSKVMDHEFYLTDVYGPRLTNSPGFKAAGDWVVKRLQEYGLTKVREEPWAGFGPSWTYTRYSGHMIAPQYQPLIGFPYAWTRGTNGVVQGDAIYAPIVTEADFEKYKGKLKGKMVLTVAPKNVAMLLEPQARRLSDSDIAARLQSPDPSRLANPFGPPTGNPPPTPAEREKQAQFRNKVTQFLNDEG